MYAVLMHQGVPKIRKKNRSIFIRIISARKENSHAAGRDVAINLAVGANENDAVAGGITLIPFHLVVRYWYPRSVWNVAFAVGDDGDVLIAVNLEDVRFEGVRFPAAGLHWFIGLHELLEPLPNV